MKTSSDRHELFKELKSTIRGSEKYLLVGVDVAKNDHHAFFGTPNGKTLRKNLVFDNSIKVASGDGVIYFSNLLNR